MACCLFLYENTMRFDLVPNGNRIQVCFNISVDERDQSILCDASALSERAKMFYRGHTYYYLQHRQNLSSLATDRTTEQAIDRSAVEASMPGLWVFVRLGAVVSVAILGAMLILSVGPQA